MPLLLSVQQQSIVQAVSAADKNIQVVARAGCGKTTTILAACEVAQGSIAFFAFNKAIAAELATKAPKHVNVQTLHSLGFSVLRGMMRCNVDADKTYNLIVRRIERGDGALIAPTKKLVGLVKNNLVMELTDEALWDLATQYDVDLENDDEEDISTAVFRLTREVIKASVPAPGDAAVIDFDDMIWLPAYYATTGVRVNVPQYDWTFVDEAQDLNAAQMRLVLMVSRNGRVCYVGDPAQAIYAFRGADSTAMDTLAKLLGDYRERRISEVETLSLTQTRRCPRTIVNEAKVFVPDFEALPEAPEGTITTASDLMAVPGDMVLCRVNKPLVGLAFKLLKAGVPARIQGRDIGSGLIALVKRMKASSVDDLMTRLDAYSERENAAYAKRFAQKPSKLEAAVLALEDRVETTKAIASTQTSVQGVMDAITRLFSDMQSARDVVLLSTIHKAKGLEAPRVWYIQTKPLSGPQEDNLRYVAITRAKTDLVYVNEPREEE